MNACPPNYRTILAMAIVPALISFACLGSASGGSPSETEDPAENGIEVNVEFGPGAFVLQDPLVGLVNLSSYTATLTISFNGTRGGEAEQSSKNYVTLVTKEPAARLLTVTGGGGALVVAEAQGASYERPAEGPCVGNVLDADNPLGARSEPAGFLNGVIGAEETGSETVNDVASTHYTFDQRAFGLTDDFTKSTGELWIAVDGGYVVKYLLTTVAGADYFGEGIEGTQTWDYELTGANQPLVIELPADCPAGMIDAPLMPDAANVVNMPGVLSFDTASSPADVAAFYEQQLVALGWNIVGEPATTEATGLLQFARGSATVTVAITAEAGLTSVSIVMFL